MKAPPLLLGGNSPVVAYLRHSIMVVFPEPLYPTISVSGVLNWMASRTAGLKERTPEMESLSIFDMLGGYRIEGRVKAKFAMLGREYLLGPKELIL